LTKFRNYNFEEIRMTIPEYKYKVALLLYDLMAKRRMKIKVKDIMREKEIMREEHLATS